MHQVEHAMEHGAEKHSSLPNGLSKARVERLATSFSHPIGLGGDFSLMGPTWAWVGGVASMATVALLVVSMPGSVSEVWRQSSEEAFKAAEGSRRPRGFRI